MATSKIKKQKIKHWTLKQFLPLRVATLVSLSIVGFASAIAGAWLGGERTTSKVFAYFNTLEKNPPWWISCPDSSWEYLLVPTIFLLLTVWAVMKISPQPRIWSQTIVVGVLLALVIRYTLWRSLSTLNLTTPLNGVFSLGLFFLEMLVIFSNSFQLYLILKAKNRLREADQMAVAVMDGSFTPSVDILIPTYNEPAIILRRTIIGCQALKYSHKKIYLLDDSHRPEIKNLANELGCNYITRPDNKNAKAGNLNNGISKTNSDLIAVFDADFIPTKNFLERTVGFFKNQTIALVQTHQSFYNPDAIARNLGLENVLTQEVEIFSRYYQPLRDGVETALCYGSSFVVRRSALEAIGGFVTDTLGEDYFTGICLSAQGYRVIYLGESLSAGLSAENMTDHIAQRLRWTRGSLQAFFIHANPLRIPGLGLLRRLAHLEGLIQWFNSIGRVIFLFMPLTYSFLGVIPLQTTFKESLYFFLPYYLVHLFTFSWLNHRSRSALISDIYAVAGCFPISLTIIQTMLSPFSQGFKVTPKGVSSDRYNFNWHLAWPLIILFIATLVSLWKDLEIYIMHIGWSSLLTNTNASPLPGLNLAWIWSLYNLLIISITLLIFIDVPKPDLYEWFNLRRVVRLNMAGQTFWGVSTMISEVGAQVALTQKPYVSVNETLPVTLEIMDEQLHLQGQIINTGLSDEFPTVRVEFIDVSLSQQRRLVEMLFCRPAQWKRLDIPGEFESLLLLFKALLKPKFLFNRNREASAINVSNF